MIPFLAQKRMKFLSFLAVFALTAVAVKLSFITIAQQKELSQLALEQWERSFPLTAPRGLITDRQGKIIAQNRPVESIAVIPYQIKEKRKTAEILAKELGEDVEKVEQKISRSASIVRLHPEGRRLSEEVAERIASYQLPGVYLIADNQRVYPYKEALGPLLGFVGIDNQGLAGVESHYDKLLTGINGSLNYQTDAKGGFFPSRSSRIVAPVEGMTLSLTLNMDIQSILDKEVQNAYVKYQPSEIIALAMDPNTGGILACTNRPTYDNNDYLSADPTVYNRVLPVFNSYEPGSTFKALSFAAALNENLFDMDKDYYYDKGYEIVSGSRIKSWKKGGHGLQTFLEVLQNSSNPGFVEIARRLGKDKLFQYLTLYGVGQKTGVDISGENKGLMFAYDKYNPLEQATSAFGQGISVTAVQLVRAFCSTVNGGILYTPHILKEVRNGTTGDVVYTYPISGKRVLKEETSFLMRRALESVVALGTAKKAYIEGYRVFGKTGTSQIAENGSYVSGKYILSFIAGAPANDPKIVVYLALKEPKNCIQYGGTTVGPIIREVLLEALPLLGVDKQDGAIEKTPSWDDEVTVIVPNYIGKSRNKVHSSSLVFTEIGEGDVVLDQLPKPNSVVPVGSTVCLLLGEEQK